MGLSFLLYPTYPSYTLLNLSGPHCSPPVAIGGTAPVHKEVMPLQRPGRAPDYWKNPQAQSKPRRGWKKVLVKLPSALLSFTEK